MPQQAVTNGYWNSEYLRAQASSASKRVVAKPDSPVCEDLHFSHSRAPFLQA